jgi:hypothetical protein
MKVNQERLGPCGVQWGTCPHCIGEGLRPVPYFVALPGASPMVWCPKCSQQWPEKDMVPCPRPGVVLLVDEEGGRAWVCESHAAHPSAKLIGTNVTALRPSP